MVQLSRQILLRSPLPEVGILSGNCFSCLGAFHNHIPLMLCKGQHHREKQMTGEGVLCKFHVQNMYLGNCAYKNRGEGLSFFYKRNRERLFLRSITGYERTFPATLRQRFRNKPKFVQRKVCCVENISSIALRYNPGD